MSWYTPLVGQPLPTGCEIGFSVPPSAGCGSWRRTLCRSPAQVTQRFRTTTTCLRSSILPWLGDSCVYSCPVWAPTDSDTELEFAQSRKTDWYRHQLRLTDGMSVLDVGCGWGGPMTQLSAAGVEPVGLTLSDVQRKFISARHPELTVRLEHWMEHPADAQYDALLNLEAIEHFTRADDSPADRAEIYRHYFEKSAGWLGPAGRLGLQTFCFEDVGRRDVVDDRGPIATLLREEIFPESSPAHLSELVVAWEPFFRVISFSTEPDQYVRTISVWLARLLSHRDELEDAHGVELVARYRRYLAAVAMLFRRRRWTLYRIVLERRPYKKS